MAKRPTSITEIENLQFVGRDDAIQFFWNTLHSHARHKKQRHHVLEYYGVGGIGKSSIQKKLVQQLKSETYQNFLVARVNLADLVNAQDAPTILYHLRSKLKEAESPMYFPRFDYAYLVYYAKINAVAKTQEQGFLKNLHLDVGGPAAQTFVTDTVTAGLLGSVSTLVSKLDDSIKKWWDKHRHPELELFHTLEVVKMIEQLPELLAKDLQSFLAANPLRHLIIFLDTLENLKIRDESNKKDKWLRYLIIDLPQVLWVISGRDQLKWDTDPRYREEDWSGSLFSYPLEELLDEEAETLLDFYQIAEEEVRKKIMAASQNHPLYLNLSIATYQSIAKQRPPVPEDFGKTFQEIYERFIRHITTQESDTFKILSCVQNWNEELLEQLLKEFNTAYYGPQALQQVRRFSFVSEVDGTYMLHQLMQEHLYEQYTHELPDQVQRIHQLCFKYLQEKLNDTEVIESRKLLIIQAVYHVKKILPATQVYRWIESHTGEIDIVVHFSFFVEVLTPLSQKLLSENNRSEYTGSLLSTLGTALFCGGNYLVAEPIFRKAMQIGENEFGHQHINTGITYDNLARLLEIKGEYKQAEPLYHKVIRIREKVLGKQHPDTANSYNNLAVLLERQGKYEEAEPLHRRAIQIKKQVLGEEHPNTATSYSNLAVLLEMKGKYKQAEPLYHKVIRIREKVLGKQHPDTANSYNNLAVLLERQGKYEEAEPLHRRAIQIKKQVLGEEHPDTATSYSNLAGVLRRQGKYEEAEPLVRIVKQIKEKVLGKQHPDTATSYNNLAHLLNDQGKYEQAEPLYRKAVQIKKQVLGEEHPDTAVFYNNLAGVLRRQGKYEQAELLYRKAVQIKKQVLGEEHPDTAVFYNNLAGVLRSQGKDEEAEPLYRKAIQIKKQVLGEEHPDTATSYNDLAGVLRSQGKDEEAKPLYRKAIQIKKQVLGEEHPDTANSYNDLAVLLERQGKDEEAELLYRDALKILELVFGSDHPNTKIVRNNLNRLRE
ncbi:tetratricopeptide repeat protein [Tunicatimonas pelagia]|uniref:tetratricopeptide repeat protein n=1 Tax=Tunicatimonas pelagia TaxID=931531 RepID=UPI0026665763|nr:tetratricopeptide repeat protein [Tunicatimonas pelagia]WKN44239.1 tetratricopeptide repeat protein [Tunicatimonas pelagia]